MQKYSFEQLHKVARANKRFLQGMEQVDDKKRMEKRISFQKGDEGVTEYLIGKNEQPRQVCVCFDQKPIEFGPNSRPRNKTEKETNNFLEFHLSSVLSVNHSNWKGVGSQWIGSGENSRFIGAGTKEGLDILIKNKVTKKALEEQMMEIYLTWKRGIPFVLNYKGSFKWVPSDDLTKSLKLWMIRVLQSKEFAATIIQSYIRRKLVYIKYKKEISKICETIILQLQLQNPGELYLDPCRRCWELQIENEKENGKDDSSDEDLYN